VNEAQRRVAEGLELEEAGDKAGAEAAYREAAALSPEWSVPHFNLGLLCKHQCRWRESLDHNTRAATLSPKDQGAWWNMGIAATALGEWSEARRAWRACGMQVPDGSGPPDFSFGMTPVRLDPWGQAEVVWGDRLDPARARIVSIPLPTSPHNHGDVVLTDGSVEGKRVVNGREYPVFNALDLVTPSTLRKYVIELATADAESVDELLKRATELGGAAENWGTSTNIMCAECSQGTPHAHPDRPSTPAHPHCGLAARDDAHAEEIIRAWLDAHPKADLIRWFDAAADVR
jgi:tetratricopeptide (TPR) repeat protein